MDRPNGIICVGNRHRPDDDLGPRVHDLLAQSPLPAGIALVDGGLRGLDLLWTVERVARAVFVDALAGFSLPGDVVTLRWEEVAALAGGSWGHEAGLPYLFHLAPRVCDGPMPELMLIGAQYPAGPEVVAAVAARALAEASRP